MKKIEFLTMLRFKTIASAGLKPTLVTRSSTHWNPVSKMDLIRRMQHMLRSLKHNKVVGKEIFVLDAESDKEVQDIINEITQNFDNTFQHTEFPSEVTFVKEGKIEKLAYDAPGKSALLVSILSEAFTIETAYDIALSALLIAMTETLKNDSKSMYGDVLTYYKETLGPKIDTGELTKHLIVNLTKLTLDITDSMQMGQAVGDPRNDLFRTDYFLLFLFFFLRVVDLGLKQYSSSKESDKPTVAVAANTAPIYAPMGPIDAETLREPHGCFSKLVAVLNLRQMTPDALTLISNYYTSNEEDNELNWQTKIFVLIGRHAENELPRLDPKGINRDSGRISLLATTKEDLAPEGNVALDVNDVTRDVVVPSSQASIFPMGSVLRYPRFRQSGYDKLAVIRTQLFQHFDTNITDDSDFSLYNGTPSATDWPQPLLGVAELSALRQLTEAMDNNALGMLLEGGFGTGKTKVNQALIKALPIDQRGLEIVDKNGVPTIQSFYENRGISDQVIDFVLRQTVKVLPGVIFAGSAVNMVINAQIYRGMFNDLLVDHVVPQTGTPLLEQGDTRVQEEYHPIYGKSDLASNTTSNSSYFTWLLLLGQIGLLFIGYALIIRASSRRTSWPQPIRPVNDRTALSLDESSKPEDILGVHNPNNSSVSHRVKPSDKGEMALRHNFITADNAEEIKDEVLETLLELMHRQKFVNGPIQRDHNLRFIATTNFPDKVDERLKELCKIVQFHHVVDTSVYAYDKHYWTKLARFNIRTMNEKLGGSPIPNDAMQFLTGLLFNENKQQFVQTYRIFEEQLLRPAIAQADFGRIKKSELQDNLRHYMQIAPPWMRELLS